MAETDSSVQIYNGENLSDFIFQETHHVYTP